MGKYYYRVGIEKQAWLGTAIKTIASGAKLLGKGFNAFSAWKPIAAIGGKSMILGTAASMAGESALTSMSRMSHGKFGGGLSESIMHSNPNFKTYFPTPKPEMMNDLVEQGLISGQANRRL